MSSNYGKLFRISIFGESHGNGIGVVIDNVPPGLPLDLDALRRFMQRRAPGRHKAATPRKESDLPEILSGYHGGVTTGTPLAAIIRNHDTRSGDYQKTSALARPGHADYTGHIRYQGHNDIRGGGHFSARQTAPLCFAGAVALQLLEKHSIYIGAHLAKAANIADVSYNPLSVDRETLLLAGNRPFPVNDESAGEKMAKVIEQARLSLDSVGGVVECGVIGMPSGIGSPMFDTLEGRIASILFGIPAVKGVEFGAGFAAAETYGSQNNDCPYMNDGHVCFKTNHAGGIYGGISSGMPIILRAAFKPTPSISQPQNTIDYLTRQDAAIEITGRHDPCVAVRAVPVVEAAVAVALMDCLLEAKGYRQNWASPID